MEQIFMIFLHKLTLQIWHSVLVKFLLWEFPFLPLLLQLNIDRIYIFIVCVALICDHRIGSWHDQKFQVHWCGCRGTNRDDDDDNTLVGLGRENVLVSLLPPCCCSSSSCFFFFFFFFDSSTPLPSWTQALPLAPRVNNWFWKGWC